MKTIKTLFEFFWKGLVMGFINIISLSFVGGVLRNFGLKFPEVKDDFSFIIFTMFLSGFVISIIGGIIVKNIELPKIGVFISLYLMLSLNAVTQLLEGLFFAPGLINREVAPAIFGSQFLMYLFISAGIALLFRYNSETREVIVSQKRSWISWLGRIFICSGIYVILYFVFGSINSMLFTGEYYRAQVGGLSLPSTVVILKLEAIRAVILVLSIMPVVLFLNVSMRKRMVIIGSALFIIGGLLPMLLQLKTLPTVLVVTSIFEMFFQFFLTGVFITYILLFEKANNKGLPSLKASE